MWRKRDPRCDSIVRLINQSCNASIHFLFTRNLRRLFIISEKGLWWDFRFMSRFILRCLAPDVFMIFRNLKNGENQRERKVWNVFVVRVFFLNFILKAYTFYNPCYSIFVKCFNGVYPRALCVYPSFCWEYFHMQIARFQEKFANFQWIIIINLLQSSFYRLILRICGVLKE